MKTGKIWTKDEERHVLMLFRRGMPYREIAEELGVSKRMIVTFIERKRQSNPRTWQSRDAHIKRCTQPCVDCFFGSGAERDGWKCPWADRLEPVPGWDAVAVPYYVHNTQSGARYDVTFDIKSCPRFERG